MSLWIDIDTISDVMIGNQWYPVLEASFDIDAYEFLRVWQNWTEQKSISQYQPEDPTGCVFLTVVGGKQVELCAPMASIQAVLISDTLKKKKVEKMKKVSDKAWKANGGK